MKSFFFACKNNFSNQFLYVDNNDQEIIQSYKTTDPLSDYSSDNWSKILEIDKPECILKFFSSY